MDIDLISTTGWFQVKPQNTPLDNSIFENIMSMLGGVPGIKRNEHRREIELHASVLPLLDHIPGVQESWASGIQVLKDKQTALYKGSLATPKPPYSLRDYQNEAVSFIKDRPSSLILHDLGMGKTSIVLNGSIYPALVVCPTSSTRVWTLEGEAHGLRTTILQGTTPDFHSLIKEYFEPNGTPKIDLFILTYGSADSWLGAFRQNGIFGGIIKTLIGDEAHVMQKKYLSFSQAFRGIKRDKTILLTATPFRNRFKSIWNLLDICNPGAWGPHYEFRQRYCGASPGKYGLEDHEPSNVGEFMMRFNEVALRETWASLETKNAQTYRPLLLRKTINLDLPRSTKNDVINEGIAAIRKLDAHSGSASAIVKMTRERLSMGKAKAELIYDNGFLRKYLGKHKRVIIWIWHKEVATLLTASIKAIGVPLDVVKGDTDNNKRQEILKEWQYGDASRRRVLIATLGALSSSVNLVTADAALFVEIDYAPLTTRQAEKRHHRFGNKHKEVFADYLQIADTIDERIQSILLDKIAEEEYVIGNSSEVEDFSRLLGHHEGSDEEFLKRVAQHIIESEIF